MSYPPSAGTYQPQQPSNLRPESNRTRADSATAEKYRPRTYSNPPPSQPDPSLLGSYQQAYTPTVPENIPQHVQTPLYPQPNPPIQAPGQIPPPGAPQGYPFPATDYPRPSSRHSSYAHTRPRPSLEDRSSRRPSHSSQRSRRSHESRRAHDDNSRRSRDGRRSHRSAHDSRVSGEEGRHSRDHDDGRGKPGRLSRKDRRRIDERPTMGDSLYSFFGLIKSALGPRDKA